MKLTREEYDVFMDACMWHNRVNLGIRYVEWGKAHRHINVYSDDRDWVIKWFRKLHEQFNGRISYHDWKDIWYYDDTNDTSYHWFDIKTYRHSGNKSEAMVIDARSDFSWDDLTQMEILIFPRCGSIEILFPEAIEIID